jgi:hypothetical protein
VDNQGPPTDVSQNGRRKGQTIYIAGMLVYLVDRVLKGLGLEVEELENLLLGIVDDYLLSCDDSLLDLPERLQLVGVDKSLISHIPLSEDTLGTQAYQPVLVEGHGDNHSFVDIAMCGFGLVSGERPLLPLGSESAH